MSGTEELGRLFCFDVELVSRDATIDLASLIGKDMTVSVETPAGERHFHGTVAQLQFMGEVGNFALYKATLRPWLWRLTMRSGCRIFKDMSIAEIITEIFREHGLTDFKESLSGDYEQREYTVQYRESDFDFVSRWMERVGIYYYFMHEEGRVSLVLADGYSAHETLSGYEEVPFFPPHEGRRERDHITTWTSSRQMTCSACVFKGYDFTRPTAEVISKLVSRDELADAKREAFDYPGSLTSEMQGEGLSRVCVEAFQAHQERVSGQGEVLGLSPGRLFRLTNHPREDQNQEYLIVSASYEARVVDYESVSNTEDTFDFRCEFSAIPSKTPFRSQAITPWPKIFGPQTAKVVGDEGEEIWTDEYGRVKVQFHWDREGRSRGSNSGWVRVAQAWAGAGWGAIHIPRVGQEVIVEHLEGDPDCPIVTGRVYNANNMPPYALPDNHSQSGFKSRTIGGAAENFNELRFDDKKDEEQVYLQAEKNLDTYVKNDESHIVDHDRKKDIKNDETTTVGGNRTETVEKDETLAIKGNRTETVEKDETLTIKGSRKETVEKDETLTVKGSRAETVEKDETLTIKGSRTETVEEDETLTIKGSRTREVGKDEKVTIKGSRARKVSKDESIEISGARTLRVSMDEKVEVSSNGKRLVKGNDEITVKGKLVVSALQGLELKVGTGSIVIDAGGNITIKGLMVKVEGSAMVDVKASGVLSLAGAIIKGG
jgi:type VI secretion system secreted protein VgrG